MARNTYEIDENLETPFDFQKLKRISKYVTPYKKTIVLILFLMATSSIASMYIPIIFMKAVDNAIPNHDLKQIIKLSGYILAISIYISVVLKIRTLVMNKMGQNIIFEIRKDIFEHVQKLPFTYFDNRPHGKIQVRIVNYVNNLSDLLSTGLVNVLTEIGSLFFIVGFMLYINVRFTILCMIGLPFLVAIVWFIQSRQRKAWQEASNKQSNLNAYISESINGIRITQSFVREKENRQIFNRLSNNYRQSWMKAVKYNFLLGPAIENISAISTAIIYVLSVYWVSGDSKIITAGGVVAFASYVGRFWSPITAIAGFYNSILTSLSYLERIFETMDEPIEVKDREDAIDMPEIKGEVKFENVCFAYEEGQSVLNGVSFKANVGESFAIVGPTGAGKTTIVNLLSRFYNINSGHIYIDNIDIETVKIKSLRTQMGVMMQESFIFSGTIMDNIRYGNQNATDEEVIKAAKIVCAHDFIMEMEDGYNTTVKERGSGLSAGQKQLISFARALLANPKILILDEATSSIDTETEIALQEGLKELLKNRTSFIIAHRLSTIKNSTRILYVDKGQIIEQGSHDELIAKKGAYYKLYMSQYEFLNK